MISVQNVSKSYGTKKVLDGISLEFQSGRTHVLLGSSGCGKSTLLRILMGLIPCDSGSVRVGDLEVSTEKHFEVARRVGYVIQEGGLFPHLTTAQNVALVAKLRGWTPEKTTERLESLCALVQLDTSVLKRFPKQISGGQRQRVALMRALMLDPPFLLMDEPLGALDPIIRSELQQQLKAIFRKLGKTVIIVTHDVGEAAYLGDSITLLRKGTIIQHGTFSEFNAKPKDPFVSRFINAQRIPEVGAP
ncbi:MAG: ATP-binding cassette domain-containing protein [Bdellovibrionaceae bacterium]|nr:ATP-binding cassette domain-containing protein [Bdellovibrionales bacterium]MCB9255216.1 ATP-binding cassette domain-containing protein [Pseudobdellovibrionaceae bacterium]